MKTLASCIRALHQRLIRRAAYGSVSPVLLALTACSCGDADETVLGSELEEDTAREERPAAPLESRGATGALREPLLGSDACKNADIRVVNWGSDPITVRSMEFYDYSDSTWRYEDLTNRVVYPDGAMEFWTPDLQYTKGDEITSFEVFYDHLDHSHTRHINTPDQVCVTGAVYLLEIF